MLVESVVAIDTTGSTCNSRPSRHVPIGMHQFRDRAAIFLLASLLAACGEPQPALDQTSRGAPTPQIRSEDSLSAPLQGNQEELIRRNHASLSPTGDRIVFHGARPNGRVGLFIATAHGQDERVLFAPDDSHAQEPRWSPDGEWIAFVGGDRREVGGFSLYRIRPDGRDLARVTSSEDGKIKSPTWSPDGQQLAYEVRDYESGWSSVWRVSASGGEPVRATPPDSGVHRHPRWSPDGASLLIGWVDPDDWSAGDLYLTTATGDHAPSWLPREEGVEGMMAWAPDGESFAFSRADPVDGQSDLFLHRLTTGATQRLTESDEVDEYFPTFSPDGAWLYYDAMTTDGEEYYSTIERMQVPPD